MPILGATDIAAMLADIDTLGGAAHVTVGSTSGLGLLDDEGFEQFAGELPGLSGDQKALVVQAGVFSTLRHGVTVTVDGIAYRAHHVAPMGDGGIIRVVLAQ